MRCYLQLCSSKLVSSEWIRSLFNADTTRITPLDFRLTAASQFRLLAVMCSDQTALMEDTQTRFQNGQFFTPNVLTESSFHATMDALLDKFRIKMDSEITTNTAAELVMLVIEQSQTQSALQTNALQFAVPSWHSFYPVVMASYPSNDAVSMTNVSLLTMI